MRHIFLGEIKGSADKILFWYIPANSLLDYFNLEYGLSGSCTFMETCNLVEVTGFITKIAPIEIVVQL